MFAVLEWESVVCVDKGIFNCWSAELLKHQRLPPPLSSQTQKAWIPHSLLTEHETSEAAASAVLLAGNTFKLVLYCHVNQGLNWPFEKHVAVRKIRAMGKERLLFKGLKLQKGGALRRTIAQHVTQFDNYNWTLCRFLLLLPLCWLEQCF